MKHLRTFERFSSEEQVEEGVLSFLGVSTEKDRMKKLLPKNLSKYVFDITKGRVKRSNPNPEATETEWSDVATKLIAANFNVEKMEGSDVEKKMAKYLYKRVESSVASTASTGHQFGSTPNIGQDE